MINVDTVSALLSQKGHVYDSFSQEQGQSGFVIFTHLKENENLKYAIKVFDIDDGSKIRVSESKIQECQNEAFAMKKLNHKNVVEYHSDYQIQLFYFIQMKKCESSLYIWSKQNEEVIPNEQFYSIAKQILDGLKFIHDQGWILRDLKPQNILINYTDSKIKIRLCDFGAATCYPKLDDVKSTAFYGSLLFTPPEVIFSLLQGKENVKQTQQGDIWAFGICLSVIGKAQLNQMDYNNNNWQVPTSPLLTPEAQIFVNYILEQDPQLRPKIEQIRSKLDSLFSQCQNNTQLQLNASSGSFSRISQPFCQGIFDKPFIQYSFKEIATPLNQYFNNCIQEDMKFQINEENFGSFSDNIWVIISINIIFCFLLAFLQTVLTGAENVTLVVLLWIGFCITLISNSYFIYSKVIDVNWIILQAITFSFINLALNQDDPSTFKVFFAIYQVFIILLLFFINDHTVDQPFCYLIFIYPIFFQFQYNSVGTKLILITIFLILFLSIMLHIQGIQKKLHLQGLYASKSILNFLTHILLCIFYGQINEFCGAFLLNIISTFFCSILQLKIQIRDENQKNTYQFSPRMTILLNNMLPFVMQNASNQLRAICILKIVISCFVFLFYIFLFYIEEHNKRNKIRLHSETLLLIICFILDLIGIIISNQSEGVAIFSILLSLEVLILIIFTFEIFYQITEYNRDVDSLYI